MSNPYLPLPSYAFWRRAISGKKPHDVDPVTPPHLSDRPE
jgi:hypothetical protein